MKLIILVAVAIAAVAVAAPSEPIEIVRQVYDQRPEGGYDFGFENQDGTKRQETAVLKQVLDEDKKPHDVLAVSGSFSYIKPDGTVEDIKYEADEYGFRAFGPSIPVARR